MAGLQVERLSPSTLILSGDLDMATAGALQAEMDLIPGPLTLDMSGVTFMDSTGLHVILSRSKQGKVTLCAPADPILRLLELSGVNGRADIVVESAGRNE